MNTQSYLPVLQGIAMTAYGVDIQVKDSKDFKSPLAFDAHDLWLGSDFDFFLDNMLDDLFNEIEEDLLSVWSTNKSEQESANESAQRSANADAMGLDTDGGNNAGDSGMTVDTVESNDDSMMGDDASMTNTSESSDSLDHDLSDHSGFKHKGHFHHPLESRYSGTNSENLHGDTQGSHSHGTSNNSDGKASTVSTQSITLKSYENFYSNNEDDQNIQVRDAETGKFANGNRVTNAPGGIMWEGDGDAEYIFGTSWADILDGGAANDLLYGFEGDDEMVGGDGNDKMFGDAGDDEMYADSETTVGTAIGDVFANLMSGGSGNDRMYGHKGDDAMFGGPGHDLLYGGRGAELVVDTSPASHKHLYGEDGADEIWPSLYGTNDVFGGNGDDMILGGIATADLNVANMKRLPRNWNLAVDRGANDSHQNLDIDGGAGNDFIIGGSASDDIFGGDGNDVIYGSQPEIGEDWTADEFGNDEIDGGRGDDIIFGVSTNTLSVLRGGEGNDTIYGGGNTTIEDMNTALNAEGAASLYIYGDEGMDMLYGADNIGSQYLFGGEGDDIMTGGYGVSMRSHIDGGQGDDTINPGSEGAGNVTIRAGKGDDKVNVLADEDIYDADGNIDATKYANIAPYGHTGSGIYDGGEGNDEIWAPLDQDDTNDTHFKMYGGNGDDILKGGDGFAHGLLIAGQGDQDLIDTQWLHPNYDGSNMVKSGDLVIFGDWGYGPEDNRYGMLAEGQHMPGTQSYGRDKKLWGDADVILLGYGDNTDTDTEENVYIYAGDGDDEVDINGGWFSYDIYGGYGNDIFTINGGYTHLDAGDKTGEPMWIYGGPGDDVFKQSAESIAKNQDGTQNLSAVTELRGGAGNDKFFPFVGLADDEIKLYGGDGDNKFSGGSGFGTATVEGGDGIDIAYGFDMTGITDGVLDIDLYGGDDTFFGADGGQDQSISGNSGNDNLFGGNYIIGDGTDGRSYLEGGTGNDLVDLGDYNTRNIGYGNDGNDKVIGGQHYGYQKLYGGNDDDKMWSINPDQRGQEIEPDVGDPNITIMNGGEGNDTMYGNDLDEYIFGDWDAALQDYGNDDEYYANSDDGDDVMFGYGGEDYIYGLKGDDFMDGGDGEDTLVGGAGNDKMFGGADDDYMYGDEYTTDSQPEIAQSSDDDRAIFGDDKMYGGEGEDYMYGSFGDDFMKGGEGNDEIIGGVGEDTIYGDAGADTIQGGFGWDTIFGGDGCDNVEVADGGDVVWLGDCDGGEDGDERQELEIRGTGDDPENFVVVMDFWLESAKPYNRICLYVGENQDNPSAARCNEEGNNGPNDREINDGICVNATEIADPEQLYYSDDDRELEPGEWRGPGCKHDGGPLWISIPIVDDPVVAQETRQIDSRFYYNNNWNNGYYFENDGGNTYAQTIWARFFQRAHKKPIIDRKKPRITTYNNPERYEYSSRYESQGRDLAGGSENSSPNRYNGSGGGFGGSGYGFGNQSQETNTYYPRISHRGYWSQTESFSHDDEELVECLRIWLCDTETTQYHCYDDNGDLQTAGWGACGSHNTEDVG